MRLALFAALIFLAGLWPGLAKYNGHPDAQPAAQSAEAAPSHPLLVRMAGVFKIRL